MVAAAAVDGAVVAAVAEVVAEVVAAEAEAVVTIPDVIESASDSSPQHNDNKPKNPTDLGAWFSSHAPEVISCRSARCPEIRAVIDRGAQPVSRRLNVPPETRRDLQRPILNKWAAISFRS